MLLLALIACQPPASTPDAPDCGSADDTQIVVVSSLTFARRTDGVSVGVDLDDDVSDAHDAEGCNQPDLVDPNGVPGIDNTFSALLPALEATEGAAIESLLQQAIDSGELLLMFQLDDLDDPVNDDCVGLDALQGSGTPLMGTDGVMLSGQTFDRDPTVADTHVSGLSLTNGNVVARGFEMQIPVQIFDADIDLTLHDAAVSLQLAPDGTATGYIAGGVDVAYVSDLVSNVNTNIGPLVISLLETYADLYPDDSGTCPEFSIVFEFTATSAFLYPDPP